MILLGKRQNARQEQGQALVEFALVFTLLMLVLFGVLDLSRIFHADVTINNAARVGARFATLSVDLYDGMDASERSLIQNAALMEAQSSGVLLDIDKITPTCPEGCGVGKRVRVSINYEMNLIFGWVLPSPIQINRAVEMMMP